MKTFSFIKPDPTLKNNLMTFGYSCDKGWYPLIETLFEDISFLLETKYLEYKEDFEVMQVKEKFGGLRVYVSHYPQEIADLIDKAEEDSFTICEICGETGECKELGHWYKTVCPKHWKEWTSK